MNEEIIKAWAKFHKKVIDFQTCISYNIVTVNVKTFTSIEQERVENMNIMTRIDLLALMMSIKKLFETGNEKAALEIIDTIIKEAKSKKDDE